MESRRPAVGTAKCDGSACGWSLFGEQLIAVGAVLLFSFAVSYAIGLALKAMLPGGIRATEDDEDLGLDITQHAENGHDVA